MNEPTSPSPTDEVASETALPEPSVSPDGNAEEDWTSKYDRAWKGILDRYLREFLAFYFPDIEQEIDWSQPVEILDTELRHLDASVRGKAVDEMEAPDEPAPGGLRVDKLYKVTTRTGEHKFLLLHVEVQGDPETGFPMRMYLYNGRAFDRFRLPVISLAILGDVERPKWRPKEYGWSLGGFRTLLEFPTAKLVDYDWDELASTENPFGLVTIAHRRAKETRSRNLDAARQRLHWRRELMSLLLARGWPEQERLDLWRFVASVLSLPSALEKQFEAEVQQMEERAVEPFLTVTEERGIKRGLEEGRREGREEGREEGRLHQMGMLRDLATQRFGDLPDWAVERLQRATVDQLDRWGRRLLAAKTLEDFFDDE